jgi:hypothetical protein
VADLPEDINICYLAGQFAAAVIDSFDPGSRPDSVPYAGLNVKVRALPKDLPVTHRTSDQEFILADIDTFTDLQGRIVDGQGNPWIAFVAPSASLSPGSAAPGEPWKVTVTVSGPGFTQRSKTFVPLPSTSSEPLQWTDIIEVAPSTPAELEALQQVLAEVAAGRAGAEAARDDAIVALEQVEGFAGTNNEQVAAMIATPGPTRDALGEFGSPTNGLQEFIGLARNGQRDLNILLIGDSTTRIPSSWALQLPGLLGEMFPAYTVVQRLFDGETGGAGLAWGAPTTAYTGTGTRTITVWNAGSSGKTWTYQLNSVRRNTILAVNPDLVFLNHGHNLTNTSISNFTGLEAVSKLAIERIRQQVPSAAVVLFSQNPRTDFPGNAEGLADVYRRIAAERGYGFIDVNLAFHLDGRPLTDLVSVNHPNAEGFAIWVDALRDAFRTQPDAQAIPRSAPSLAEGKRNYLPNGELALGSDLTLASAVLANVSVEKETGAAFRRSKDYVVHASKITNTSASMYWVLPVSELAGKTVTVTVVMWLPAGVDANTAQLQFRTNAGILASGYTDSSSEMKDQWTYRTITATVPTDATYLRFYINVAPASNTNPAHVYLDQAFATVGTYPTEAGITPPPLVVAAAGTVDVQTFTAGGTWTMPAGAKFVEVQAIGGGGGGGSGRRGAASSLRTGGAGGGGGGVATRSFPASSLGSTVTVNVGAGGAGGPASTTDDTGGVVGVGSSGGVSSFGSFVRAIGGGGGQGGNASGAATAGAGATGMSSGGSGAASSATGGVAGNASSPAAGPAGGGAGGGITTADVPSPGSNGATVATTSATGNGAGGAINTAGGSGTSVAVGSGLPGPGGGGGGASITGAGGSGGAGGSYGAGGGGGGASLNGSPSGAGGAGADGVVIVTTSF